MDKNFNISAAVIWYNPQKDDVSNVNTYAFYFSKVFIIDNSDIDNSHLANEIKNAVYVPNKKNLGIATALNQACHLAKQEGFEWLMTMDMDSFFDSTQLNIYMNFVIDFSKNNSNVKSFSIRQKESDNNPIPISKWIRFNILSPIKRKILGKKYQPKNIVLPSYEYKNTVMTSANIINLHTWNEIGFFDDNLFIDEVDHNYCIRLRLLNYEIVKCNEAYVFHTLGNKKISLFPKIAYENDFRLFYIFRNLMIENKRFGSLAIAPNYKNEILNYIKDYCIFSLHPLKHLGIFIHAYKEYKKFIKEYN